MSELSGHQARKNQRADANRRWLSEYKESHPCLDCNVFYPFYVMDFDHVKDKKYAISVAVHRSRQSLVNEIAKCELVCSNCHRQRTFVRTPTVYCSNRIVNPVSHGR